MVISSKSPVSIMGRMPLLVWIFLMFAFSACAQDSPLRSSDGKYQAELVGSGNDWHYQVKKVETGEVVLTTHAQYPTPNDVKAGMFSPDSKEFAAAYHYGHKGPYTWIGVWDFKTGKRVRAEERDGWIRNISFVFKK